MDGAAAEGGVIWRALGAWAGLRASMRAELDRNPSEGRLLYYLVLFGLVWLAQRLIGRAFGPLPVAPPEVEFTALAAADVLSLFFLLILMYALAATAHALARALGGTGGWRDSRAALFWGALVAAPPVGALQLMAIVLADADLPGWPAQVLGSLLLGWAMAQCLAEAHGFASPWRGLAAVAIMVALYLGGAFAVVYLSLLLGSS